jgi:quercetin dioxygenase-like cupin family protein
VATFGFRAVRKYIRLEPIMKFTMRSLRWGLRVAPFVIACVAIAMDGSRAQAQSYVRSYRDAKFQPLNPPMSAGAEAATLWGDAKTGPSALLFKMREGATPLHIHSSSYHLVVIEGVMKHWVKGEREADAPELPAGSYWHIAGNVVHADSCLTEVCVAFIKYEGPRDGTIVESP